MYSCHMKKNFLLVLIVWVVLLLSHLSDAQAEDHTLFYGDSLVERLMESGHAEAWVQLAEPDAPLRVRSLAWTGDEVGYRLRPEVFAEHLKNLLAKWPAKTVVLAAGMGESFHGAAGVSEFKTQLAAYIKELQRRHPAAKLWLMTPIAVEEVARGGNPDVASRNRDVELYVRAMSETAAEQKLGLVDLFSPSRAAYAKKHEALTSDGIHPNDAGARLLGRVVAAGLVGEAALSRVDAARVDDLAKAFAQKNYWVAEIYRPKNADVYYGVRRRPDEYAAEMPRYHQLIEMSEKIAHEMARSPGQTFASQPVPSLPPMPEGKRGNAGKGTGIVRTPAEEQAEFKVADGFAVNLFASEEMFPELRAPVQIAFDARGRLWVVTMPSFPHTVPGRPREDKILILEDTDHDGKADTCTVFADGLDALDGVAFSDEGVLVSEQPRIWVMRDTNGDGKADTKRELIRGIDTTDSHHGGMIATDPMGHVWFCDGVFHRSQIETPFGVHRAIDSTTYSMNPRTNRVETEWQSSTPNPWKITYDRTGNMFQMYGDGLVLDGLPLTWTPMGAYHPFGYATILGYSKGSAAMSISSPNFPDEYQQGMASASCLGLFAVSITKHDFSKGMVKGSGRIDVVTSKNPAFRPVDVAFGFDGALYASDFSSAIIGHAQHPMRDPQWNHTKGRIWRVVSTAKPVSKDFPKIEGASADELCKLLEDSRDIVRHHARIELRKLGDKGLAAVDAWIGAYDRKSPEFAQAALETVFVAEGLEQVRPALLAELFKSESPLHRAAATRMLRYQADRLPDFAALLHKMSTDPHPRVRMEVVGAVAHLRPRFPQAEHAIHDLIMTEPVVKKMFADLQFGIEPTKGRSVEVLQVPRESQVRMWSYLGANGLAAAQIVDTRDGKGLKPGAGIYRTWIEATAPQPATLSVRYGYVDISINDIQLLSTDSMWSSEQQVQFELKKGLNVIDVTFRKIKDTPPAVYVYDPLGQPLTGVVSANDTETLQRFSTEWAKVVASAGDGIRIQTVPNRMQYAPRQFAVKAGQHVKLTFSNPDQMLHNFVLVDRGADEEVGTLAEKFATQPDAQAKAYVPESKKILQATGLVLPEGKAVLEFDAPKTPGEYPYICTFPGHWRVMRGVMVVVAENADPSKVAIVAQPGLRPVVKNWAIADLEGAAAQPAKEGAAARGKATFETAGCVQCHAIDGKGGKVGPELNAIGKKYKGRELLLQIIEPSAVIDDKYKSYMLTTKDGAKIIGQIIKEDATTVAVLVNPLTPDTLTSVPVADIKQRKPLPTSPMPVGLLDTFKQEEILDLLRYLEAHTGP